MAATVPRVRRPSRSSRSWCSSSSGSGRKLGGERTWCESEPGLAADGRSQSAACLADRLTRVRNITHIEPRDAHDPDLNDRSQVVESGGEELAQLRCSLDVRRKKRCVRAEM